MYISSLTLKNFRNYKSEKIEFSPLTNLIYGNNAQGKTNILEAVYLFAHGRSHRAKADREMIRFGSEFMALETEFHDNARDYKAELRLAKNGKKNIRINHVQITKLSMLMSYLNVVMFSPEDLELVKGSPSVRRRFIDSAISQLYPSYLANLIDYNKALVQKNFLLKNIRSGNGKGREMLDVWNLQLAQTGAKIMKSRRESIELLCKFAAGIQNEISGENLTVRYAPGIKCDDITEDEVMEFLQKHSEREIDMGSAQYGVQRDDIAISVDEREARLFSSQGQQRTAALSLKLSELALMRRIRGEAPVLLLDDVLSELDGDRQRELLSSAFDCQCFLTSTTLDGLEQVPNMTVFECSGGKLKKILSAEN